MHLEKNNACVEVHACKCACASKTLRPIDRKIKLLVVEIQKNTSTNLHMYIKAHCLKWSILSAYSR
jgi:hypothetical protein